MSVQDHETRERLIQAAARLFADRGFADVTVREICAAADANVAAINYHFRDKLGLYAEVVQAAIRAMRETSDAVRQAGDVRETPEQKIGEYVRVFMRRVIDSGPATWIHKLMNREMQQPTEALDLVVEQALRPRLEYLGGLIAEMLECPPNDPRVLRSVVSIQGQCLLFVPSEVGTRLFPDFERTFGTADALAAHVTDFSLAGIRALKA